jgi:deazaflavin-dependent oxidoreductase (nitroreductase family)
MPSDLTLKTMNALHRVVMKLTFGKIGWQAGPMPVVELTTTGRKSGEPRTVLLTSPVQEGDVWVLVASRGGDDHHPAWFLNLRDDPNVEVRRGGKARERMRARVAGPDERARLWPQVTATYKGYAGYQTKTDREIPLVLLESATDA